ncbi:hypothetical protein L2800_00825 [Lactobacillus gasseri]|uniref:hypothetical protein n=1 Tax=Lactobacillus gasseri TaxID=1596 RepID=UPI000389F1D4|nr:hypothetical protein [Lactobacillus gasseri]MCZ3541818.1 hypothetical protein [Lactobacillus gasseri]MCZ3589443.1 hypothetical protein [Lactobacillus gasseri]UJD19638.1 hypothetical protein M497_03550 [Lactobacillus gasseri 2016]
MENKPTVGEGCEIKQTPQGVYVDGVKQKGAIDVQIKKNSRQWTEVQITYRAHSFFKEKIGSQDVLDILQKKSPASEETGHNMKKLELKTEKNNVPMTNWSRVIIETAESNPKLIAIVTNDDFELANGFRVRLQPIYKD